VTEPAVCFKEVSFSYGNQCALEGVDFDIEVGDFVSFIGPNGGGKTTLLKLILGLLQPDSGVVQVFGQGPSTVRGRVGYMPQRPRFDPLFPVSVFEVVLMGCLRSGSEWGGYGASDKDRGRKALSEVGLDEERKRPFGSLSGGQQQRALIARALVSEPEILLLDEPTANLDVHVEGELYELLERINQRMTIVLVSHDLGFVARSVRTVVCVNQKVRVHPTTEQITADAVREIYGEDIRMVRHDVDFGHDHSHD